MGVDHEHQKTLSGDAEVQTIFTPVNLVLLSLTVYLIYTRLFRIASPTPVLSPDIPIVFQNFTAKTLAPFNGLNNEKIYMAVEGKVFDVTSGKAFYGPAGPYENFSGRDASIGLAKNRFDEEVFNEDMDSLTDEEINSLKEWKGHFESKYLVVGKLVGDEEDEKDDEGKGL